MNINFDKKHIPKKSFRKSTYQKKSDVSNLSSLSSDSSDFSAETLLGEIREDEIKELEDSVRQQAENIKSDLSVHNNAVNIHQKKMKPSVINEFSDEKTVDSSDEIKLLSDNPQKMKRCPVCNGKLKKSWIKKHDNVYAQKFRCKGKGHLFRKQKCEFTKELVVKI